MSDTASNDAIDAGHEEGRLKVYFDGGCPLCRSEIAHYRKLDAAGRVDFVDLSSPAADIGPDLSREAALGRFHVRGRDGELESGAAAFVRLWKELPGWRWLAVMARVPGVVWIMERAYRGFLPIRPRLARYLARTR
jgi:predicted DCC family thiol-disulfide oxidoreductase YuxK